MKVIIAMDSFKGSCSAYEAGEAVRRGIFRAVPTAQGINIPVADGGEGTVEVVIANGRGVWKSCRAKGPLGDTVNAGYGVLDGETAVIEMSAASGLILVPPDRLNPLRATTYGTGELIKSALDAGYRKILLGLGGSATNDGGAGMAQALGVSLRDEGGSELGITSQTCPARERRAGLARGCMPSVAQHSSLVSMRCWTSWGLTKRRKALILW